MIQKARLYRSYPKVEYLYENRYKPLIVSFLRCASSGHGGYSEIFTMPRECCIPISVH